MYLLKFNDVMLLATQSRKVNKAQRILAYGCVISYNT
jgi:hypothetical protein